MKDGKIVLPQSIGHTAVSAGTTEDVKVTADMALEEGGEYHAMIHYDTNGNGEYEFGEGSTDIDTPGMRPDGTAYGQMFKAGGM